MSHLRPDGCSAGMVWTIGPARKVKMAFSSPKMAFSDLAGARVRPVREGNAYTLIISGSPIYFVGGEMTDMTTLDQK